MIGTLPEVSSPSFISTLLTEEVNVGKRFESATLMISFSFVDRAGLPLSNTSTSSWCLVSPERACRLVRSPVLLSRLKWLEAEPLR